jgi:alpha-beta hydrolase superfamily lysophospholipase
MVGSAVYPVEPPPGPAAALHGDLELVRQWQGEELSARGGQLIQQPGRQAMASHVEKAAFAAGGLDLPGHASPRRSRRRAGQRAHIDDGQCG